MRERIYILVEGNKDTRFVSCILYPLLQNKYRLIRTWKCAEVKEKTTAKLIRVSKSMGTCLFIRDIDDSPCKTAVKQEILAKFNDLSNEDIQVVVTEIEGWYLAGANPTIEARFGINLADMNTNTITKEAFLSLKPKNMTKTTFYGVFLNHFDIEKAKERNESFRRFIEKCAS